MGAMNTADQVLVITGDGFLIDKPNTNLSFCLNSIKNYKEKIERFVYLIIV